MATKTVPGDKPATPSAITMTLDEFEKLHKASFAIGNSIEALHYLCREVAAQDEVMHAFMTVIEALADSLQKQYEEEAGCLDELEMRFRPTQGQQALQAA